MKKLCILQVFSATVLLASTFAWSGQVPYPVSKMDIRISHHDRVYAAEQFSNTVSVIDPASNTLLGLIKLGDLQPVNFSPLYKGQLLVHGLGFSPDGKTLVVVSIGSNSVSLIDTETNKVKHITYVGRSPHEAFFTPDGKEIWVTVRGEDYVAVLDGTTGEEKTRIKVPGGPGMQIFSPDGQYGYVCSSFNPETVVVSVKEHRIVGSIKQASPFCPNIAASPDGQQVWFTLKDVGKVQVFDAHPPFSLLKTINSGPITNHVNIVQNSKGSFAYVTIGGLNKVNVYRTDDYALVDSVPVGSLPHGLWPSGDGTRIYVGLENADAIVAIDTLSNKVVATIPVGQAPQAVVYVPNAVEKGEGKQNLIPPEQAGNAVHLALRNVGRVSSKKAETTVSLFDQGLTQILQASVSGLNPGEKYLLALSADINAQGPLEPLAEFMTNPAGAAIVNAVGPIRQIVKSADLDKRRYLVIVKGSAGQHGLAVQVQEN